MAIDDSSGSRSIPPSRVTDISISPIPMRTRLVRVSHKQKQGGSCESLSSEISLSSHQRSSSSGPYEGLLLPHHVRTTRSLLTVSLLIVRVTRCEASYSEEMDISMRHLGRVRALTMRILDLCGPRVSVVSRAK
jgi:hypothetical protein